MVVELRWKQRFANFERAWQVFCRILGRYRAAPSDEVAQMALTQAFEFTYELAWQSMKDYVTNEGFDGVGGSRDAIRTAFQAGLLSSGEEVRQWNEIIDQRNVTSHTYDQSALDISVTFIVETFAPLAGKLYEELKRRCMA